MSIFSQFGPRQLPNHHNVCNYLATCSAEALLCTLTKLWPVIAPNVFGTLVASPVGPIPFSLERFPDVSRKHPKYGSHGMTSSSVHSTAVALKSAHQPLSVSAHCLAKQSANSSESVQYSSRQLMMCAVSSGDGAIPSRCLSPYLCMRMITDRARVLTCAAWHYLQNICNYHTTIGATTSSVHLSMHSTHIC